MRWFCLIVLSFLVFNVFAEFTALNSENFQPLLLSDKYNYREFNVSEIYIYDWLDNEWQNQLKFVFSYNSQNLMNQVNVYWWNGSVWAYDHQELYTYDDNENIIEVLIRIHDGGWHNFMRYVLTYSADNVTELIIQNWIDLEWQNSERFLYSYDANSFLIEELHQYYTNTWWDDVRHLYTNDDLGNIEEILEQNYIGSSWIDYYLTLITYDANYNEIEHLGQFNAAGNWQNDILNTFEYDNNDVLLSDLEQYWFMDEWWNSLYTEYTTDANDNLVEELVLEWSDDDWLNDEKTEYLYEEVSSDQNQIVQPKILLRNSPNPFNPSTTIFFNLTTEITEDTELAIYNLKGQKVKTFLINPSTDQSIYSVTWNGKDELGKSVSSGIYYHRLKIKGRTVAVRKCLLLK